MPRKRAAPGTYQYLHQLSPSEHRYLALAAEGWRNREIATALCVTERTVRTTVNIAYHKIGARNRVEAALIYHGVQFTRSEQVLR